MSQTSFSAAGTTFEQARRRLEELRAQRAAGHLDDAAYRLEVAKLLLRDEHGTFWMLNADSDQWLCNRGRGWEPGDPGIEAAPPAGPARRDLRSAPGRARARGRLLALAAGVVLVLSLSAGSFLARWPAAVWGPQPQTEAVRIASPADGSQALLGQDVAVESTVGSPPGMGGVAWVELRAGGQVVDRRDLRGAAGRGPIFLSQVWHPAEVGDVALAVVALAADGRVLGAADVTLHVVRAETALPGPDCTPASALTADVTIHPGMAFPPGARMDKVWQVQNRGACAWGTGFELVFVGGRQLGAPASVPVPVTPAGGQAALPVTFWAPASGGIYTSTWQLRDPHGRLFGPLLSLKVRVEAQAVAHQPPAAPGNVQAAVAGDGRSVLLSWEDRSDNEDAFRIYRTEVEASVGLVPANVQSFVDEQVACGHAYRYTVVAFNAAGGSASDEAGVTLAACPSGPAGLPPLLVLTVLPAQVGVSGAFTVTFQAEDDLGLAQVRLWGQATGDPAIDAGRVITCSGLSCIGVWPLAWTRPASRTLTIAGVALDAAGQESEPAQVTVAIPPR